MKSLVTGSNGFIGSHLVEHLIKKEHHVRCLIRKSSNLQWIHDLPVTFVYGDVTDLNSLLPAVKDVDFVFHLGGTVRAKTENGFYHVNYDGTKNLLDACCQQSPNLKKFIFISSQAAVGPNSEKKPFKEHDSPQPISIYGKSKLKAEQAVLEYQQFFPVTIIRPPSVYGPRDDDILEMFKYVNMGFKLLLGMKDKYISLIHVHDLVQGIILAVETAHTNGEIYFLTNDEYYSINEIETAMAHAMNKRTINIRVPEFLIDVYAAVSEFFARITGSVALVNKDKALEMKQRYWLVDNTKAKADLGFYPTISLEQGIRETFEWYKKCNWL